MPKILVANRGEIAIRILRTATELGWSTVAIYTTEDFSHATFADEAVKLESPADYMNADKIADVCRRTRCTHVHPGYGFLSESPALALALSKLPGRPVFIGPDVEVLQVASDKVRSRELARSLGIAVCPGERVHSLADVRDFARQHGFPVMIKALDGGGGRGIRLVRAEPDIEEAFTRCQGESPSRQLFVEKALVGPAWKHIEVQIVGDGTGQVNHFWERECSVQRRYQKIVEFAPSRLPRVIIQPLLSTSIGMASRLRYRGLGTFEYLANAQTGEWVFLEINPRVQVEHTITEEIMGVDLIRLQLLLFGQSATLASLDISAPSAFPTTHAIQLRLTAEDPANNFKLTPGTVEARNLVWPCGPGIRVDSWIASGPSVEPPLTNWTVGTDFDSLLAKIIVRGRTFAEASHRAERALKEIRLGGGLKTNIEVLAGVIAHSQWYSGAISTSWLEQNLEEILALGRTTLKTMPSALGLKIPKQVDAGHAAKSHISGNATLQPGTLFHLTLSPVGSSASSPVSTRTGTTTPSVLSAANQKHTLTLTSIAHNNFPEQLSGVLQSSFSNTPYTFSLLQSSTSAAGIQAALFELADPNDPCQIASPLTGKIVEIHPALVEASGSGGGGTSHSHSATGPKGSVSTATYSARRVKKGETLVVLTAMKMENAVVAPHDGFVSRIGKGVKPGVVLGEGMLVCGLEQNISSKL
ncbi:hypothetical protein AX16_007719 [Volvariella volvacea WC 439]|nr:hypothetical protein AX16_007719 [Volvariella volvacea WC 439]